MTEPPHRDPDAAIRLVSGQDDPPRCPRCAGPGLVSALVPHVAVNGRGESIHGRMVAVLCATCDIGDPDAGALIAFLTVNGEITDETVVQASRLISAWANVAKPKPFDLDKLAHENELWLRGEL